MSVDEKNFLTLEDARDERRSRWSAIRSALVADVLRRSARSRVRQLVRAEIHGESMLPALWPGDVIEIEGCSLEDVQIGEIVLAQRDDRLVIHRMVARRAQNYFLLRGDSVAFPDPPFLSEALLGRLVRRSDGARPLAASALRPGFGAKWSRAVGMVLCHFGLARRVALKVHSRRKASARGFRTAENTAGPVLAAIAEHEAI
ncbi:MAG TPA: S24/S26 family peptidase [Terriglobales bacterium]|nr:S24/S26 family peptidase [Terriglobales bacterium]